MSVNLLFSILNVAASAVSSLLLVPIIKTALGIEAYGYVALGVSLVNVVGVASLAVTSMSSRFITVALEEGKKREAARYFNSIMVACLIAAGFIIALTVVIAACITAISNTSAEYVIPVRVLLVLLAGSSSVVIINTPFISRLYCTNKLYIMFAFNALSQLSRVIAPIALFPVLGASIWLPYLAAFIVDVVSLVYYATSFKKQFSEEIPIDLRFASISRMWEVLRSGIWVAVNRAGSLFLGTANNYLSNILFGATLSGVFASIFQLQSLIAVFASAVVTCFAPQLFRFVAKWRGQGFARPFMRNLVCIGIVVGIVGGVVDACSVEFLSLWLNMDMSEYAGLAFLLVSVSVTFAGEYLNQLFISTNKVLFPAIVTIVAGIANVGLVLLFCVALEMGIDGIAWAQVISTLVRLFLFYVPYASKQIEGSMFKLFLCSGACPIFFVFAYIVGAAMSGVIGPESWIHLIASAGLSILICGGVVIAIACSSARSRKYLGQTLLQTVKRNGED